MCGIWQFQVIVSLEVGGVRGCVLPSVAYIASTTVADASKKPTFTAQIQ